MAVFTRKVHLVWEYSDDPKYQFDKLGNCYNIQSGKQLQRTLVDYTEGYCLGGKFKSIKHIRTKLKKILHRDCPF